VSRFNLVLLVHAHQPVGNFDRVIERAYQKSYLPFVQLLLRHPFLRAGVHYSGGLLEWLEKAHPEYFKSLKTLVERGQVELLGGGVVVNCTPSVHFPTRPVARSRTRPKPPNSVRRRRCSVGQGALGCGPASFFSKHRACDGESQLRQRP